MKRTAFLASAFLTPALLAMLFANTATAKVTTYTCAFRNIAFEDGRYETGGTFDLKFVFDDVSGNAFFVGNAGASTVYPVTGSDGITFLEPLKSGAVQTTTIDNAGKAAHSRHTIMFASGLYPSQSYGNCHIS